MSIRLISSLPKAKLGIADKLLNAGVKYAEENNYKIVPICSYVVKKFEKGGYDHIKA